MERPVNGKWIVCWVFFALCIFALWTMFYWLPPRRENPQQEETAVTAQQEPQQKEMLRHPQEKGQQEPQQPVELPEHLRYLQTATVDISTGWTSGAGVVVRQEGKDTFILTLGYVVKDLCWLKVSKTGEMTFGLHPAAVCFFWKDAVVTKNNAVVLRYSDHKEPALLRTSCEKRLRPVAWSDGIDVLHVHQGFSLKMTKGRTRPEQRALGGITYDRYDAEMGTGGGGGGGIFLKDGQCLGLLSHGGSGSTLALPTAAIRQWARDHGVAWAIDHALPVPSEEELKKLPVWPQRHAIIPRVD